MTWAGAMLLAGCERVGMGEVPKKLVVCGQVQTPSLDSLEVQVSRVYRIDEPYENPYCWSDSVLTIIWRGRDTAEPYGWRDWQGLYNWLPALSVRPGDTFNIMVAKPGYDSVRGRTIVPDTFHILYPRQGDTVTLNDSLGWTRSRTAAGYYMSVVRVEQGQQFAFDLVIGNDSTTGPDSNRVNIGQMLFFYGDTAGWKRLTVYAVDTNYYDWITAGGFGPGTGVVPESTHLEGGLGVFGSAVVETVGVYFRTDTAARRPDLRARSARVRARAAGTGAR